MREFAVPQPDDRALWDIWMAAFHFPALAVADELGIFTFLEERPIAAEGLAVQLSLSTRRVEQLLTTLVALGFLRQSDDRFGLTSLARNFLLPTSEFYWGPALSYFRQIAVSAGAMLESLRAPAWTPRPPEISKAPDFEGAAVFTRAMHSLSFPAATAVALTGDFTGVRRFLDVGGGSGSYCIALAFRHPEMRFTVLDTDDVAPTTREFIAKYGLQERIDVIPLDMFNMPWPPAYDAHFFSNVFHDFEVRECLQLASTSHAALPSGGRIYVHEVLLENAKSGPLTPASFSLAMTYFNASGGQFTRAEIEDLLIQAGFRQPRTVPTYGYYSLTSATK